MDSVILEIQISALARGDENVRPNLLSVSPQVSHCSARGTVGGDDGVSGCCAEGAIAEPAIVRRAKSIYR